MRRTAELRHTLIRVKTVETKLRAAALRRESEYGKELMSRLWVKGRHNVRPYAVIPGRAVVRLVG